MADEKLAEFLALSAKVSDKTAGDTERERWRALRAELASKPEPLAAGQTARVHARGTRKLRVHYAPLAELAVTFTDEIGAGGLRLRATRHLEPGTVMLLHLQPSDGAAPAISAEARVVWSRREGGHFAVGVELVNLPAGEAERLEALLQEK